MVLLKGGLVNITINTKELELFMSNMKTKLPMHLDVATHNFANIVVKSEQKEVRLGAARRRGSSRVQASNMIHSRKIKRSFYGIDFPLKLIRLDSMSPHFVSLNKIRNINRWASKYFGTHTVSGRSRVYRTKRGILKGALYVTPDPFIIRARRKVERRFKPMIERAINKTLAEA